MAGPQERSLDVTVLATVGADADAIVGALRSAGLEATASGGAADLCQRITADHAASGAIVVVEEALAGSGAADLARALEAQPAWSDLPVVVLLSGGEPTSALGLLGHITMLQRPVRTITLASVVRTALQDRGRQYDIRDHLRALAQASEHKDVLLGELAHRVKNTLAVIQAVVAETRRTSATMDDFVAAFEGRLRALAVSHDALQSTRWQGGDLEVLLRQVLSPFLGAASDARLVRQGRPVILRPEATQAMSMIFHELASNAAKYGALSCETGKVRVQWEVVGHELHIQWQEEGGPPPRQPERRGYGSMLVERLAPYQFGGASSIRYEPEGVRCEITLPQKNLAPARQP